MRLRLLLSAGLLLGSAATSAATAPLWSFTEENDGIFTHQDRHYTQGFRVSRSAEPSPGGPWQRLTDGFGGLARRLGAGTAVKQRDQWPIIGQSEFTPQNKDDFIPDPKDRPYAGWLYLGAGLEQTDAHGRTDRAQLLLGVVGPLAFARQAQNGFHKLFGYGKARGWDFQLHNEPALLAQYQTIWDLPVYRFGYLESDALPETGVTLGNVLTYGELGGWLRIGHGLAAGGTPETITPGLSGSGGLTVDKLAGAFGWMLYGGVQTRAVWRNLFLEGNSYQDSPGVEKRDFVTDETVGISFLFRFGLRLDITYVKRGREFSGQNYDDRFGSITVSAPL